MLVIAIDLEDYMGQYGIVWNRGVVEVASTTCADIIEEYSLEEKNTNKNTNK
jgi:hypothetical protein